MSDRLRVALVEERPEEASRVLQLLEAGRTAAYDVFHVSEPQRLAEIVAPIDVVLINLSELGTVKDLLTTVPVVVLSRARDDEARRQALQQGAQDYVIKDGMDAASLWRAISYAVERHRFVSRLDAVTRELSSVNEKLTVTTRELTRVNELLSETAHERERRIEELASLNQVAKAGLRLDLDHLLDEVVYQVLLTTEAAAACVLLQRGQTLTLVACRGHVAPTSLRATSALFREVLRFQQPRQGRAADAFEFMGPAPQGEVLLTPILGRSSVVAVVAVFLPPHRSLNAREINLVTLIGRQAAVGIESAQLYRERDHVLDLLQQALVPGNYAVPPNLQVGHRYLPSSLLSGDYYDVIPLPYGRIGTVIVDVSGKGTDAAIDAVRVKAIIQTNARVGFSPAAILGLLNDAMLEADATERTLTCFFLDIALHDGHVRYACAGHEPALVLARGVCYENGSCDVMTGALPSYEYTEHEMRLMPGDVVLLYTDGVTESRAAIEDFYGRERLMALLVEHGDEHPQTIVDRIYTDVETFCGGAFTDDLSLLCLRWLGPP